MPDSIPQEPKADVSRITGEFRDPNIERRFRHDQIDETVSLAKFLFALGFIVSLSFLAANLILTEYASAADVLVPRGVAAFVSLAGFLLIGRIGPDRVQPLIVSWAMVNVVCTAMLLSINRNISEVPVFLLPAVIYLVVPTSFRATIATGASGSAVLFATYAGSDSLTGDEMNILVALVLTNVLLAILKSRSGQLVRRAWATATNYRKALVELDDSRRMLERTFMAVPTPLIVSELESGIIIRANEAAERFLEPEERSLVGHRAPEFYVHPSDRTTFTSMLRRSGFVRGFRTMIRTSDGEERSALFSASNVGSANNSEASIVTSILDITEIERRERNLQLAKDEYQALFDNSVVGIYRSTSEGKMLRANAALVRFNGYSSEEELIRAVNDIATEWYVQPGRREQWLGLMHEHGRVTDFVSEVYRHSSRERVWVSESSWIVHGDDGEPLYFEGTLIEATDRKRIESEFQHMASHDQLTSLANRWLLTERLEQASSWVQHYGGHFAVLCIDLDRFKPVNDAFGHATGDLLLQKAASRLKSVCRVEDTVARIGGDEFAVLCTGFATISDLSATAQKILDTFSTPFVLDGPRAMIGVSIGIAVAPGDGADAKELLARADKALYRAKEDGRNTYRFANPEHESVEPAPTPAGARA